MTYGNLLLPAAASGQKAQPETLVTAFLRDVTAQRVANKSGKPVRRDGWPASEALI